MLAFNGGNAIKVVEGKRGDKALKLALPGHTEMDTSAENVALNAKQMREELATKGARLVAVSKTKPVELLMAAYNAGQRIFGENYPQELAAKAPQMPADVEWHMIGSLQRNKVKLIVPIVTLIHGVDSEALLAEINKEAAKLGKRIDILLQVHIALEETKHGFTPDEASALMRSTIEHSYPSVRVCGLMGMATFTEDDTLIEKEFRNIKTIWDELRTVGEAHFNQLSIGMSGDYGIALKHGATLVRIGSNIFGPRNYAAK